MGEIVDTSPVDGNSKSKKAVIKLQVTTSEKKKQLT